MAQTDVRSEQIRNKTVQIEDLKDFAPTDGGELTCTVKAGRIQNDNSVTDKSDQNVTLSDDTTNYVELNSSGVASDNTSGFTSGSIPIAIVVTESGGISSITDKRAWIQFASGTLNLANEVDDFTIHYTGGELKIDDRVEQNILLNAFRIAINGALVKDNMVDGIIDEFEDESGVDTGSSTNEDYDSTNDLYSSDSVGLVELDYMEYASDSAAQAAYVADSSDEYGGRIIALGGNLTGGYTVINEDSAYRIGKTGTIKVVKYYTTTAGVSIKVKVFRINGTDYDLVGESEAFSTVSGGATRVLTAPIIGVQSGDIIGLYTPDTLNEHLTAATGSGYAYNHSDVVGTTAISDWSTGASGEVALSCILTDFQCFSEASIKQQGSYSLKAEAVETGSLNDTLAKSGLSIDLSGRNELKIDFYASRTGANIQLQIHDSGGTTSTKDITISSADTWETTTWDISGIADADKDNIDQIIIKIINADADNEFYVDNFYSLAQQLNMTLISQSTTAEAEPDNVKAVIFEEDVDSITLNTDLLAYASIDGTNWDQITLTDEGDYGANKRILSGLVDVSARTGTSMKWKLVTANEKELKIHGIGLLWG